MACSQQNCSYGQLIMHSYHALIAIDTNYKIIVINNKMKKNATQILGTEISEGMNLKQVLHDKQNFLSVWSVALAGQPSKKIFSNTLRGVTYKVSCYPVINHLGNILGAYGSFKQSMKGDDGHAIRACLEGKSADQEKSIFEILADRLPHLVWLTNAVGDGYYLNQRWCEYTGLSLDRCKGLNWTETIHPSDKPHCVEKWCESIQTGTNLETRYRIRNANGYYRWHLGRAEPIKNDEGKVSWWLGTCTDIEDHVEVESKLYKATEQLKLLMSAAHFGVWVWSFSSNKVQVDEDITQMFNVKAVDNEVSMQQMLDTIHHEDVEKVSAELQQAVRDLSVYDAEFRIKDIDRHLAARGKVIRDKDGHPTHMFGITWDVTTRKKLEQERVRALEYAEEQGRKRIAEAQEHHKRLEEFVDTICHEIRNPLNGIIGITTLMKSILQPVEGNNNDCSGYLKALSDISGCIGTLEQCAEQQQIIVDDVLDLSKAEKDKLELNPTVFNLKQVIASVEGIFLGLLRKKNLDYVCHYQDGLDKREFKADTHRLSQILMNLLSNAVKFSEQGTISLSVSKEDCTDGKCSLRFCVTDNGIGMTPEEVSKLFNKFLQANPATVHRYGGSGLGLAISKKLVERMGGQMKVESKKGVGTRFQFSVVCEEVVQHQVQEKRPCNMEEWNLPSLRILIVEDNVINQKILTNYMQQKKCHCQVANNGSEAVDMCDETKFDVIFMDLEMPVMGGLEATKRVREHSVLNQHTPIIGLSGNARKEHKDEAIRWGMNDFLTKPYHKCDIYKAVKQQCTEGPMANKRIRTE